MRHEDTQAAANWSILLGGLLLFVSLFLTWSHQFAPGLPTLLGRGALAGVRIAPDAWQVYSAADILLCLLAVWLGWCAVTGRAAVRWVGAGLVCGALAFVAHALGTAPTSGVLVARAGRGGTFVYAATGASAGAGEVVALAGLALALIGLGGALIAAGSGRFTRDQGENVPILPS